MKLRVALLVLIWTSVLFLVAKPAYAYIDPATTTYIIQVFTAIIITLGVTLSIVVYRLQSILMNLRMSAYRIYVRLFKKQQAANTGDANSGGSGNPDDDFSEGQPVYEYPNYVLPGEAIGRSAIRNIKNADRAGDQKYREGSFGFLFNDERKLTRRLLIAALVSADFVMTFIVFGVLDLVSSNTDSMQYLLPDIIPTVLLMALAVFVIITVVLLVLRGRLFDVVVCLLFAVLLAGYLQGTFLNPDLGKLTGDTIAWNLIRNQALVNLAIWAGIFALVFAVKYFFKKAWNSLVVFVPAILIVVQVIALLSMAPTLAPAGSDANANRELLTTAGLTEVSTQKNTFVFLLDRFDEDYVADVKEIDPHYFDGLDGFTHFTNNISHYRWTFPSIIEMLTGYKYLTRGFGDEFGSLAWSQSRFVPTLREQGYTTKVYSDSAFTQPGQVRGLVDNLEVVGFKADTMTAFKRLTVLSAFRYLPTALKAPFWMSTGDLEGLYFTEDGQNAPYTLDDVAMMNNIKNNRLKASLDQPNFAFYHLFGPHTPLYMNENAEYATPEETSIARQAMGSLKVVYEFIDQLKALGLYEDATIIITADHGFSGNGIADGGGGPWQNDPNVTTLFVKPAGLAGTPLATNKAPVTTENLRAMVIADSGAAGASAKEFGPTYFEVPEDADLTRKFYWLVDAKDSDFRYQVFDVKGDAKDLDSWKKIEELYPNGELMYTK